MLQEQTLKQISELQEMFPASNIEAINDFNIKIGGSTYQESDDENYEAQFEDITLKDGTIFIKQ